MWENVKRCFLVEDKDVDAKVMTRKRHVTHLIGSVYLRCRPSSVLHVVLLHLGTNFRTGSDVTCRLVEKNRGGGGGGMERTGEGVFLYQNLVKQQ